MKERLLSFSKAKQLSTRGIKTMSSGMTGRITASPMINLHGVPDYEPDVAFDF